MVTKRGLYCAQFLIPALLALVAAACGGGTSGTSGLLSPSGSDELSTSYVLSIVEQGGKTAAFDLSFAKLSEPVPGEDAVARFRVTPGNASFAKPLLLRMTFQEAAPAIDQSSILTVKRLTTSNTAELHSLPSAQGCDVLLTIDGSGEYLVTREARSAVSQGDYFVVFASADSAGGEPPHTVHFQARALDDLAGVNYHWEFGDGATADEIAPAHTYASGGSYVVTMTATYGEETFTAVSTPIEISAGVSALSGYVVDEELLPLANVVVRATTAEGIAASTVTNDEGFYSFADLPQRTYCVAFTLEGFAPVHQTANLDEGAEALDATMAVATGEPAAAPLFQFDDPPFNLDEATGIASVWGLVSEYFGTHIGISANGVITVIPVSGGSFSAEVILRPGTNDIRFIAANEFGVTISDSIEILFEPIGRMLFRATLTWDGVGDIDLHAEDPNLEHSYFGNKEITTGNLDVDNTSSYGPENFTCVVLEGNEPVPGTYHLTVHYYSGTETRNCTVTVMLNPGTAYEDSVTVGPHPLDTENLYWYAIDVEVGSEGIATYTIPGTPPDWTGT